MQDHGISYILVPRSSTKAKTNIEGSANHKIKALGLRNALTLVYK
jgi:hypothetical protein